MTDDGLPRFELTGDLPPAGSTTVLEASAGTGKTFALSGLVTRYLAEGLATLDQMLLITFSRAASRELRERVRKQLVDTAAALRDPPEQPNDLVTHLRDCPPDELAVRCARLREALSDFDAATIATTHEFCGLVLRSLGIAGDDDSGLTLMESLDELVVEIVDDVYLVEFGGDKVDPPFTRAVALALARAAVGDPGAALRPRDVDADTPAGQRLDFVTKVTAELERRKRRQRVLSYDDLLSRLAAALEGADAPARARMRQRWPIVMVDEFQDTDPVQWQVISRAFGGHSRVILIGDPKQAIYAFRGGDIVTYLDAARSAGRRRMTLGVNWRSDRVLVEKLQSVLRGAELGASDIVVRPVEARNEAHRLVGAPRNDPFRLRVVSREPFGVDQSEKVRIGSVRTHVAADLAADIAALLASDATFDGRPLTAGDIAVIVTGKPDAMPCQEALSALGIPVVYTGDTDVFGSRAADDWLRLLKAFESPNRSGLVRAAGATMFFGYTAAELAAGGDDLTESLTDTIREWAGLARERGIAAVFEAAQLRGAGARILSCRGGDRHMTDLTHVAQLLHQVAHREGFNIPALRLWLARQRDEREGPDERNRRLDSDAKAVQVMTVWRAKGLQYPIVYVPFLFNRYVKVGDIPLFHEPDGTRCLHIGGTQAPDRRAVERLTRAEEASESLRLTYVALTRAQSQIVAWWAPTNDERNGGLSCLLRGRRVGEAVVPEACTPATISDSAALKRFQEWEAVGGPVVEPSVIGPPVAPRRESPPQDPDVRHFHRPIDTTWRRTSYSALIRATESSALSSEPEVTARDDEVEDIALTQAPAADAAVESPMSDLPGGAAFGSLVHAVLEHADPTSTDLAVELERVAGEHLGWWAVQVGAADLAAAMVPMHDTPLGPLAPGLTLRQLALPDRLRELDFEIPLAGGDRPGATAPDVSLFDVGLLVGEHLPASDPLHPYVQRLTSDELGNRSLRGYLSGSIDAVLRVPADGGHAFVVVDYKTNRLGEWGAANTAADYAPDRMAEAMLHSDYPLQALLYSVVLHRFLRWRVKDYTPQRHLGGVLYLFVRGMCGPETPMLDEHPCGVFSWTPPAALIVALSDLLDRGRPA